MDGQFPQGLPSLLAVVFVAMQELPLPAVGVTYNRIQPVQFPGHDLGPLQGPTHLGTGPTEGDPEVYAKPISEFAFSMRIRRALATLNVNTLGDLAAKAEADFLTIKNFGQTSLEELKSKIAEHGITLRKN